MNPAFVRHAVLPVHEWLTGRRTFEYLRCLGRSQWWSPDRIAEHQTEKLRSLLQHAQANIPYYRDQFRDDDLDPRLDDPREILNAPNSAIRSAVPSHCHAICFV